MATYAVLDLHSKVKNLIIAESLEIAEEATASTCIEYTNEIFVSIGWLWNGVDFIDPNPPAEEPPAEEPPVEEPPVE